MSEAIVVKDNKCPLLFAITKKSSPFNTSAGHGLGRQMYALASIPVHLLFTPNLSGSVFQSMIEQRIKVDKIAHHHSPPSSITMLSPLQIKSMRFCNKETKIWIIHSYYVKAMDSFITAST